MVQWQKVHVKLEVPMIGLHTLGYIDNFSEFNLEWKVW